MKRLKNILIGLLIFSGPLLFGQIGQAVITYQPVYEEENIYFPHDYFVATDMEGLLDTAISIKKTGQKVIIINTFNDGFTGHEVLFEVSSDLEIIDVRYQDWTDVIDGSKVKYTVEKVILSMNDNPFITELITGHYTLQIIEDYFTGELLNREGAKDTTTYRIFNGKFKIYSEKEKQKGREWIIDKNEIKMGIKDSLGIYELPQFDPKFCFGRDSLNNYLKSIVQKHISEKDLPNRYYFSFVINEAGRVEDVKMESKKTLSDNLVEIIENEISESCWVPAIYYGKTVKSTIYPWIEIK